jgi:acyl-CoA synthetase (NDP forming)
MDISKLFKPNSMVVVGVTDKPSFGARTALSTIKSSIADRVYYINPTRDELNGRKCYHSLNELPETVDLMVLCTPAKTVAHYMEEAGKLGIPAAMAFASGFGEERSEAAQKMAAEVEAAAKKWDMAFCGPNCVGIVNAIDNICASTDDHGMLNTGVIRGIGAVAQSGYINLGFLVPDAKHLAYIISAGNCSMCTLEDYLLYLAENDHVNCVSAYIEGIKKPEVFVKALKIAALKRKPVVVLKAGMTEKGSFAAASHTGSLAGDYKTFESIFRKFGVTVTTSLQEFVSTSRMFAILDGRLPRVNGIGAINFSGGENTLCADTCDRFKLELPPYSETTCKTVSALLPSYSTASNPLDATTTMFTEQEKVRKLFETISGEKAFGLITLGTDLAVQSPNKDITCGQIMPELMAEGKLLPSVVVPSIEPRNECLRIAFENAGIPVLSTGIFAYSAVKHLFDFAFYDPTAVTLELGLPETSKDSRSVTLSETNSKNEIAAYGVRVPGQSMASTENELDKCLDHIPFPVVLKVDSPDISHKTDAGGVRLNIRSHTEARDAFNGIIQSCKAYKPNAKINGILVQEMVPTGIEIIIGIKNDKQFGPILLVGLGGVFVEVFKDTSLYPCPLVKDEALAILKELKGYTLLTGFRGSKPCDIDALTDLMVRVSEYAVANKDVVTEMDLNPVFVYEKGKGAIAVDARIIKKIQ